jgi:hypothetical protein
MDQLQRLIGDALREARVQRDDAGRSERGRHLSILVTDLETVEDRFKRAMYSKSAAGGAPVPAET